MECLFISQYSQPLSLHLPISSSSVLFLLLYEIAKKICVHTYTLSNPIIRFVSIFDLIQKCLLHFLRFTQRSRVVYHSRYLSLSCTVCLACYFPSSMKVVTQGKEIITLVARA